MIFNVSAAFLLLLCFTSLNTDQITEASFVRERCDCVNTVDCVQKRKISNFTVIEKSSQCKNVQIILNIRNKQLLCLNPNKKLGKILQRCWHRTKNSPERNKVCLQRKAGGGCGVKKPS
ncbi:chemokine (C-X-C motif) ligand 18a, duplicate 1 [Amia ocellicauda]|uniref:chemokine (C-X-C motif) ligand 18a, duplicate 1 n=1 Tax=Amia ocellicauda TaxID=2972642 RepID=UPI00346482CC